IKIDKTYFHHMMQQTFLWPLQSYCDSLGRIELAIWKFKLYRRFYGARKRDSEGSLLSAARRALHGVFSNQDEDHTSKMETVARTAAITALGTLLAFFHPRYMKKSEERAMFATWDATYQRIRETKLACGATTRAPADTAELHRNNVIPVLSKEHGTARTIAAVAAGA